MIIVLWCLEWSQRSFLNCRFLGQNLVIFFVFRGSLVFGEVDVNFLDVKGDWVV